MEILHISQSLIVDLLHLHNCLSSSPPPCGPDGSFSLSLSLSFHDFIRLIRKNIFVVRIFRLCFCSNCGMLYFSTVEIKKHEREMNKEERRKEKDFFFFYSAVFFINKIMIWSCYSVLQIKRTTVATSKKKKKKKRKIFAFKNLLKLILWV